VAFVAGRGDDPLNPDLCQISQELLRSGQSFNSTDAFSEIDIVFLFKTINREASAAWPNFPEQLAKERSAA
jgi:hypothetical protein